MGGKGDHGLIWRRLCGLPIPAYVSRMEPVIDPRADKRGAPPGHKGNVPHVVTDENRVKIERMAGLQISQAEIAMVMGISADTIQRHYAVEFERGKALKGIKLREHAYDLAFGLLVDPDNPQKGYKPGYQPSESMTRFMLERQFGMIPKTESTVALTDLSPEAAAWLGRQGS